MTGDPDVRPAPTVVRAVPRAGAARAWWAAIAVIITISLIIQLTLLVLGGQDANSGASGAEAGLATRLVRFLSYFTIQSNLLCLATSVTLAIDPHRDGRFWRVVRLDALLGIVITGLVYDTVLAPLVHLSGWAFAATLGFHYLAPWATLAGWFLFGPRPRITRRVYALAFLWPLAWLGYTFVHGALSGWYPYPFLNADVVGEVAAIRSSGLVLLVGLALATLLALGDRRLARTEATSTRS